MKTAILVINIICAAFVIGLTIANIRCEDEKMRIPLNKCNIVVFSVFVICAMVHICSGYKFVILVFIFYFCSVFWRHGLIASDRLREHDRLQASKEYSESRISDLEKKLKESEERENRQLDEIRKLHEELHKYRRGDTDADLQNR